MWRRKIRSIISEPSHLKSMDRGRWNRLTALWGYFSDISSSRELWIHAMSIGEMKTAMTIANALPEDLQLLITTSEHWALEFAREYLPDRAAITFLPSPFPSAISRFITHFNPQKLIIIEGGTLQPLLWLATIEQDLPTAIVDGWFNEIQFRRLGELVPFLHHIEMFGVRHEEDRQKLVAFGIPETRIRTTGDLKFHGTVPSFPNLEAQIREIAGDRPILIAGSTDPREEPLVLDARLDYLKRSQLPAFGRPAVVFLDQIGELASLYGLATAAFVGGSLVPNGGGQSPLEAARCAVPMAVGPSMKNFRSIAEIFDRADAWQHITNPYELSCAWESWIEDPPLARDLGERAAKLVDSQHGALAKTLTLLETFLAKGQGEAH
jgi:3-deoxy-D-manno-octulosonic-acid transferase